MGLIAQASAVTKVYQLGPLVVAATCSGLSKNGGAFAPPSLGTTTNLGGGWWSVQLDVTDTNTIGDLAIQFAAVGPQPVQPIPEQVFDNPLPFGGIGCIPANGTGILTLAGVVVAAGGGVAVNLTGTQCLAMTASGGNCVEIISTPAVGVAISGATDGLTISAATGIGVAVVAAASTGVSVVGSAAGNAVSLVSAAGPALHITSATDAVVIQTPGSGVVINAATRAIDLTGSTADMFGDITGVVSVVQLDATQPSGYPALPGQQMDLVNAPNATALTAIGNAVWNLANAVASGVTPIRAMRLLAATQGGKVSVVGNVVTIRDVDDTKDVVVATTDINGQRVTVVLDLT